MEQKAPDNMNIYIVAILLYMVVMLVIGIYSGKKIDSADDYHVAGRKMPTYVLIGTLIATWLGAGTISGNAALYYKFGIGGLWFAFAGPAAHGILIILSKRLRAMAKYTLPELIELRYNSTARVFATIAAVLGATGIVGYQMKAIGYIVEVIVGINPDIALIIGAVVVLFYTVSGGMWAVALTDVVQSGLMYAGLILAIPFALKSVGGWQGLVAALPPENFQLLGNFGLYQALSYFLPLFMLASIDQTLYMRIFAAKDEKTARTGAISLFFGAFAVFLMVMTLAMVSAVKFPDIKPDMCIYWMAKNLLSPPLGALLLVAGLSVIMSTSDSFLLAPATNIVKDIYVRFINPDLGDKQQITLTRLMVLVLGVIAYILATKFSSILAMVMVFYTVYGASLWFPTMAAFFWPRASIAGGAASIISGTVVTILWEVILKKPFGIPTIYIGGFASFLVIVIVSLLTPPPPEEKVIPFKSR